jgi:hypothetical protein
MECHEHLARLAPIAITMAASVAIKYARDSKSHPQLRYVLHGFVITPLFAARVSGFFGTMLNKDPPVDGSQTIQLVQGE